MTAPRFEHEVQTVGNVSGCKHCHRMVGFIGRDEECHGRLRAALDAATAELQAMSGAAHNLSAALQDARDERDTAIAQRDYCREECKRLARALLPTAQPPATAGEVKS